MGEYSMSEPTITVLLFFKNSVSIIAGAIGSLVSLRFIKRASSKRGVALVLDNALLIFGGFCASVFLSPALHEYMSLSEKSLPAVHFIVGLFGLSVAYQVNEQLGPLINDVRRKVFGDDAAQSQPSETIDVPIDAPNQDVGQDVENQDRGGNHA